jgi:hypothetical protein
MSLIDMTGKTFGRLTVIERASENRGRQPMWLCRCVCGEMTTVSGRNLRTHHTQSCGCLRPDVSAAVHTRHGAARQTHRTRLYRVWCAMLGRCRNANDPAYLHYGGRGITVCDRWQGEHGFENFLADMGPKPTPKHTLDRTDNDRGYGPDNCRWATRIEQNRNRRDNHLVCYRGQTLPLSQWAEKLGVNARMVGERLRRGWTAERAFEAPKRITAGAR